MASSNLNIRVDEDLKKQAEALFKDLGLSMSSAITVFLKAAVSHGGIPFEVKKCTCEDSHRDDSSSPSPSPSPSLRN